MSKCALPLALDSGSLLWAVVESDRIRRAKELAEQKALSAAKTDLQRAIAWFWLRLTDFFEQWGEDRPRPVLMRAFVRFEPLANAATQLATAAKVVMPTMRVPELVRLAFELNGHRQKDGPFDEFSPQLRESMQAAIVTAKELELTPAIRPEPKGRHLATKSGQVSASHDMMACKAAAGHSKAGRPWTITSIAKEIGVVRTALSGKDARGQYRCPAFMSHVRQRRKVGTVTYSEMVEDAGCND